MRWKLGVLASCLVLAGCGAAGTPQAEAMRGVADPQSAYDSLIFSAVDPTYTSSSIYRNLLQDGTLELLSQGESGDPWLTVLDGRLYLFNRSKTSSNYREIDLATQPATLGPQLAIPEAGPGDPHAAVMLPGGRMLLAHYAAGLLVVVDAKSGALLQKLSADWDLGGGAAQGLNPEQLHVWQGASGKEVVVVHQGRAGATINDSQRLFFLADDGQKLAAIDLDRAKAGVQGVPLGVTMPMGLLKVDEGSALVVAGACYAFDKIVGEAAAGSEAASCRAGMERVDLATRQVTASWDLAPLGLRANASHFVATASPGFYGMTVKGQGQDAVKGVSFLNWREQSEKLVHRFPAESSGCCALFADDSSQRLWVGDRAPHSSGGLFTIYDQEPSGLPQSFALPAMPYQGVFLPKQGTR